MIASMSRRTLSRLLPFFLLILLSVSLTGTARAASIRGTVMTPAGMPVNGANVLLVLKGKPVGASRTGANGSFQILTGPAGHYFLVVSAARFRQATTPDFYARPLDNLERNLVLEPDWVREPVVSLATGTSTPQAQTSEATSVLHPTDLGLREDLGTALRLMPGTIVAQQGQLGSQAELFVRGGSSDSSAFQFDGVDAGNLGRWFSFGPLSTTGLEQAEILREPGSYLYGPEGGSGIVRLETAHGTTHFPSLIFQGSVGNLYTSREQLELAGTHRSFDYYGAYSWLQTANDLPLDEFHVSTTAANIGWQLSGKTLLRATLHYGVDAAAGPQAWNFYHVSDDSTLKNQDLFIGAVIDHQTTQDFHNFVRYGAVRERQQLTLWQPSGQVVFPVNAFIAPCFGPAYYGKTGTITGANGASATGQAELDCSPSYGAQRVLNRDELVYQGDYKWTPHLQALIGFRFNEDRGAAPASSYYTASERTASEYTAGVHGDFKRRFYYTLGGSLEHLSTYGTQTSSHAGLLLYVLRPRTGSFNGTRLLFNFGDAVHEPSITDQDDSLARFLLVNGAQAVAQQLHISPLVAPTSRTFEAGLVQSFFGDHLTLRTRYFHNELGRQIETIGFYFLPELLPNLLPVEQQLLVEHLQLNGVHGFTLNSEAFRAQGIETTLESGLGRSFFVRGGYTWLEGRVQRSFSSDIAPALEPTPTYNGTPIGAESPLAGARPFRRPLHSGFFSATYANRKITAVLTGAIASRSDDSTFLQGRDINGGNSLLLPNGNLDFGYAKLDLGANYQVRTWLSLFGQLENMTDNQHIAPIGFPSLPLTFRTGLRIALGKPLSHSDR